MEYIIWCDESVKRGNLYSNFYGGALVKSIDALEIISTLNAKKEELNLFGEVKWTKITENYEKKYRELMSLFFYYIRINKIKIRIMFTDNAFVTPNLTKEQRENEYFILYYQLVKHAFGLTKVNHPRQTKLRINFDKIPDKHSKAQEFKSFIFGLQRFFLEKNIVFQRDGIAEVTSHDHVVLQCLDVILGAMAFRLNKQHLVKPPGSRVRGKKTRAKERVYKFINQEIQNIYPDYKFNIGITTGTSGSVEAFWEMPYRHWRFKSNSAIYNGR